MPCPCSILCFQTDSRDISDERTGEKEEVSSESNPGRKRHIHSTSIFNNSMGLEAQKLVKKLAQKMESNNGQRYSDSVSYIRRRLRFELLKTTVIAVKGDRGSGLRNHSAEVKNMDLILQPSGWFSIERVREQYRGFYFSKCQFLQALLGEVLFL